MKRGEMSSGNRPDRKTVERNRRIEMKKLCLKLVSLIPDNHFRPAKEFLSQQDQIDQSAAYIKILRERVEELKRKKSQLINSNATNYGNAANMQGESKLPILQIKDLGSDLEVVLITGPHKNFMLHHVIDIIQRGGAQVGTISISAVDNKVLHTLHAQVMVPRVGVDTTRISESIHELIS